MHTSPMHTAIPFCERCGRVGARLSGTHLRGDQAERWTVYACGHVRVEELPSESPAMSLSLAG